MNPAAFSFVHAANSWVQSVGTEVTPALAKSALL